MHRNIVDFDDWDDYEDFLEEDDDFLPFDAFGFYGDERMPYEGFCQAVIDEIADYREECGQEKADYGFFKDFEHVPASLEELSEGEEVAEMEAPDDGEVDDGDAEAAAAMLAADEMMDLADAS